MGGELWLERLAVGLLEAVVADESGHSVTADYAFGSEFVFGASDSKMRELIITLEPNLLTPAFVYDKIEMHGYSNEPSKQN